MLDDAISWGLSNPLQCVAVLAAFAIIVGLLLAPRVYQATQHGHPRC